MLAPTLDLEAFLQNVPKCINLWLLTYVPMAVLLVTTPRTSILRWLWLPCFLLLAHALCFELFNATLFAGFRIMCAALSINAVTTSLVLLVLERPDSKDLANTGVFRANDSLASKVLWTCALFYNFRVVGTTWQIKRLPAQPRYLENRRHPGAKGKIPVEAFLTRQILILAWQYLFVDVILEAGLNQPQEELYAMVGVDSEYVYRDLTPEQWTGRVTLGWITWLTSARVIIDMYYRFASVIVLGLGLSDVDIWPPLFSSMSHVYTIRGFWSTFWHQYLRWPLTSFSSFITKRILRLPTPSIIERYLNIALVFAGSGALHVLIDYYDPQVSSETFSGTFWFFSSFVVAIMLEDGAQAIWRLVSRSGPRKEDGPVPLWHKLVGYVWVSAWFIMFTPWYMYPKVRQSPDLSTLVPVLITPHAGLPVVGGLLALSAPILLFAFGAEV